MITEQDLREAIAECQGQRNPNASTCIKLAAFLTIQRELYGEPVSNTDRVPMYSYAPAPEPVVIQYDGDTDFARAVNGKAPEKILPVLDEIMTALLVYDKPLYNAAMRKLTEK